MNYLTEYAGADHLITSPNYGHNDPAEHAQLFKQTRSCEDVASALIERILCDNPKQFSKSEPLNERPRGKLWGRS